jgi:CheY-like chemotaxis protein
MPTLNGHEVCRRLRKQPWGAEMVIVALTGWAQENDRRMAREAGFDAHLTKPVPYAALTEFLAQACPATHARRLEDHHTMRAARSTAARAAPTLATPLPAMS